MDGARLQAYWNLMLLCLFTLTFAPCQTGLILIGFNTVLCQKHWHAYILLWTFHLLLLHNAVIYLKPLLQRRQIKWQNETGMKIWSENAAHWLPGSICYFIFLWFSQSCVGYCSSVGCQTFQGLGFLWHHQGHSSCCNTAKHGGNVAKYSRATGSQSALHNNRKDYVVLEGYWNVSESPGGQLRLNKCIKLLTSGIHRLHKI